MDRAPPPRENRMRKFLEIFERPMSMPDTMPYSPNTTSRTVIQLSSRCTPSAR